MDGNPLTAGVKPCRSSAESDTVYRTAVIQCHLCIIFKNNLIDGFAVHLECSAAFFHGIAAVCVGKKPNCIRPVIGCVKRLLQIRVNALNAVALYACNQLSITVITLAVTVCVRMVFALYDLDIRYRCIRCIECFCIKHKLILLRKRISRCKQAAERKTDLTVSVIPLDFSVAAAI